VRILGKALKGHVRHDLILGVVVVSANQGCKILNPSQLLEMCMLYLKRSCFDVWVQFRQKIASQQKGERE
jgi:hypothetical protein